MSLALRPSTMSVAAETPTSERMSASSSFSSWSSLDSPVKTASTFPIIALWVLARPALRLSNPALSFLNINSPFYSDIDFFSIKDTALVVFLNGEGQRRKAYFDYTRQSPEEKKAHEKNSACGTK